MCVCVCVCVERMCDHPHQVSEACEKQLATQHKLAPAITSQPINVTEGEEATAPVM